jgi:hypothetical protein
MLLHTRTQHHIAVLSVQHATCAMICMYRNKPTKRTCSAPYHVRPHNDRGFTEPPPVPEGISALQRLRTDSAQSAAQDKGFKANSVHRALTNYRYLDTRQEITIRRAAYSAALPPVCCLTGGHATIPQNINIGRNLWRPHAAHCCCMASAV